MVRALRPDRAYHSKWVANKMRKLFISYRREDSEFLQNFKGRVEEIGLKTWVDSKPDGVLLGDDWKIKVSVGIRQCSAFALLVGPSGLSEAQLFEYNLARSTRRRIIPVLLPGASDKLLPDGLQRTAYGPTPSVLAAQSAADNAVNSLTNGCLRRVISQLGQKEKNCPYKLCDDWEQSESILVGRDSFGKGVESLHEQVTRYADDVSFFVGINDAGSAIATFLSFAYFRNQSQRREIGVVKFDGFVSGGKLLRDQTHLPVKQGRRNTKVVVCDFEVKSGRTVRSVAARLRREYGNNTRIYLCVFCALLKRQRTSSAVKSEHLAAWETLKTIKLERVFIGCVTNCGCVEPPFGLR